MKVALPRRTIVAGDHLRLLVLACGPELVGVDIASGAFVRAGVRVSGVAPFDVVDVELADGDPLWSPHAPELVELQPATPVRRVGRLAGRQAERLLRPLLNPRGPHLLGFAGPSAQYWTLPGDRPSLALVAPTAGPVVRATPSGYRCVFAWRGRDHDLPLHDARLVHVLEERGQWRGAGDALAHALGFRPARVLVALAAPRNGHCHKVAAALLPRG